MYGVSLPALTKTWETSLPKSGYHLVEVLLANGHQLYAGSNGFAYQLDAGNGQRAATSLRVVDPVGVGDYTTTLAADDQTLFVGMHGYVYGISLADWSHAAWEANLAGNRYSMVNLALAGNQLLAGSYGYVFRINPASGAVVRSALLTMAPAWARTRPGSPSTRPASICSPACTATPTRRPSATPSRPGGGPDLHKEP